MKFIWEPQKERLNIKKHGIGFVEASFVFEDKNAIYLFDSEHSEGEIREIVIGMIQNADIIFVVFTERDIKTEEIRIISARPAEKDEKICYYNRRGSL